MKILQVGSNPIYLPTPGAAGDATWADVRAYSKLPDAVPNSLIPSGALRVYRMSSNPTWSTLSGKEYHVREAFQKDYLSSLFLIMRYVRFGLVSHERDFLCPF